MENNRPLHGRGAQINPNNRFQKSERINDSFWIDELPEADKKTEIIFTQAKTIVNPVKSPDLGFDYNMNPYQGCEHGCVYCYARNTHEYWGYSAGTDFEQKILVKQNAANLLVEFLSRKNYEVKPIMLSGNTDCYQPIERKLQLTRSLLEVCLEARQPLGLVTKNALIIRDIDILGEMAKQNLVYVMISITGTDEKIRGMLEPRTSTYKNRLLTIKKLTDIGIPTGVIMSPVIPGINQHEIPQVLKSARLHGAENSAYSVVRLNGIIGDIFKNWLHTHLPDRAEKVWNQINACHGGMVNDSRFGTRMTGEGKIAESIAQLYRISKMKYFGQRQKFKFNTADFKRPSTNGQLSLL